MLEDLRTNIITLLDTLFNGDNYKLWVALILCLILALAYTVFKNVINPTNIIDSKNSQLIFLVSIACAVALFYFVVYRNSYKDKTTPQNFDSTFMKPLLNLFKGLGSILLIILIPVILISMVFMLYSKYTTLFFLTQIILGLGIVMTTLGIIAYFFSMHKDDKDDDFIKKLGTGEKLDTIEFILNLIKYIIFFIPCLLVIGTENLHRDIKGTPTPVFMLLILELVLVCLVFFIPVVVSFLGRLNKHDLLAGQGPVYLDKYREIGNYQNFSRTKIAPTNKTMTLFDMNSNPHYNVKTELNVDNRMKSPYKYTYSISFYLYINPQPPNTSAAYSGKDSVLFDYAGKPRIVYNGRTRTLAVKSQTLSSNNGDGGAELKTIYETTDFKYQKWLFFVVNYEDNVIDVFIDGILVGSQENVPPFFGDDKVSIGEENGIQGSIRDIYYYEKTRPPDAMQFMF